MIGYDVESIFDTRQDNFDNCPNEIKPTHNCIRCDKACLGNAPNYSKCICGKTYIGYYDICEACGRDIKHKLREGFWGYEDVLRTFRN